MEFIQHELFFRTEADIPPNLRQFAIDAYEVGGGAGEPPVFWTVTVIPTASLDHRLGLINAAAQSLGLGLIDLPLIYRFKDSVPPPLLPHAMVYYGTDGASPLFYQVDVWPATLVLRYGELLEACEKLAKAA